MRAFEQQPGETAKAFAAYKAYRDGGPRRTLKLAAGAFYGREEATESQYTQFRRWSSRYEWRSRVQAYDDWLEMHSRAAIEEHLQTKGAEYAKRQAQLREDLLAIGEAAAKQIKFMLNYPLTEQKVVRETEDGPETLLFIPAKWSKGTIPPLAGLVRTIAGEDGADLEDATEFDFEGWTDEELDQYARLSEKLSPKRPERG